MTHTAGMLRRRHVEKQPLCTPFTASSADAYDGKVSISQIFFLSLLIYLG
jgi:hypothetical protein